MTTTDELAAHLPFTSWQIEDETTPTTTTVDEGYAGSSGASSVGSSDLSSSSSVIPGRRFVHVGSVQVSANELLSIQARHEIRRAKNLVSAKACAKKRRANVIKEEGELERLEREHGELKKKAERMESKVNRMREAYIGWIKSGQCKCQKEGDINC